MTANAGGEPDGLERLLNERKEDITAIGRNLLAGKKEEVLGGLAGVLTTIASGVPLLGKLVSAGTAMALAEPANEILEKQIAQWKAEQDQQRLADGVATAVAAVVAETLRRLMEASKETSSRQVEELVSDAVIQLRKGQQQICEQIDHLLEAQSRDRTGSESAKAARAGISVRGDGNAIATNGGIVVMGNVNGSVIVTGRGNKVRQGK